MNKVFRNLFLFLLFASWGFARETTSVPTFKKIILSGTRENRDIPFPDKNFVSQLDIHVPEMRRLKRELELFLNQDINAQNIEEIKATIVRHYQKHHRPILVVEVPPQDVTEGRVQFWVIEAQIGTVLYTGSKWYPEPWIEKRVPLECGEIFEEARVLNDLTWLNQNPFHQTEIVLTPGKKRDTTNAEFKTVDRFPLRVYAGTDNTGTQNTGPNRFYVGANLSLPYVVEHVLTYQYTAAYNPHEFQAQYGNLLLFLPCKQGLSFFGGYAVIHPNIPGFHHEGWSWQASGRHFIPLLPLYEPFGQKVEWGVDFKSTNNNLFFTSNADALPVSSSAVMLFQFLVDYQIEWSTKKHNLYFMWENYFSPGHWLPDQSKKEYGNLRPGATPLYYYTKVTLSDSCAMPRGFTLESTFRGQITTTSLLPSEQFGMGGLYTIRGYEEREFNADNAFLGNIEIVTPSFSYRDPRIAGMNLVAFIDAGWGYNDIVSAGEPRSQGMAGIGPGVRLYFKPYITAKIDYGFKLNNTSFGSSSIGRLHFSITASY